MPTCIAFTDSQILIGEDAREQIVKNPRNTIFNFKKLLGRRFSDFSVQEAIKGLLYKVEEGPGDKPLIVVTYKKEVVKYYPEEILALLISEMKKYSEAYLERAVDELVVTLPAYFNKTQIAATIWGCEKAGFKVLRTIKESQAIALGMYYDTMRTDERKVLIYNIGGSSLDVAIIAIQEQMFEVKSMNGNTHLGGENFLQRLIEYCKA